MGCNGLTSNGQQPASLGPAQRLPIDRETATDAPESIRVAAFPVPGASAFVVGRIACVSDDGQNGAWRFSEGLAARASGGEGQRYDLDGLFGYQAAVVPWSNTTIPIGFLELRLTANVLSLEFSGIPATRIRWQGWIDRIFFFGATP